MMKKDDSDVLKDIDEDEDPMTFSVMQKGLNRMKSKFNKRRSRYTNYITSQFYF